MRFLHGAAVLIALAGCNGPSAGALRSSKAGATGAVTFTILHTNDFHGQLEASGSNPGVARVAQVVADVRAAVGASSVLLADDGDEMQGSLLSNIQKGAPTIAAFNAMAYDVATFGNHEFDWGQAVLQERTAQASFPYVSANIVAASCGDTANWTAPAFARPYVVKTVAGVRVAFVGVTTTEAPVITVATATSGLCFRDPAESILHYYDEMAAASDVIVVLSHLGYGDGGYGYGIPVYGDQTLAQRLISAGKPVPLIIGGHSHTSLGAPTVVTVTGKNGQTSVVQASYNGRRIGRADLTFDPTTKAVTVAWQALAVSTTGAEDPTVKALVQAQVSDPTYQATINQPVGYVQTDLVRDYNGDSAMGAFVDDAILAALNSDGDPANDVDVFFNNPGGLRADWCARPDGAGGWTWSGTATDCTAGALWSHDPMLLTYGQMFQILPFGNATVVGTMTGAQLLELLNQSATLAKGAIQPAGLRYAFYAYKDALPGPQPWAFGAFDACVVNRASGACEAIDPTRTYRVGTNEFLAPAGGDNFLAFKYMRDLTYWGDMLNLVNAYVAAHYTQASPYRGPSGDGKLDGRIARDGTDAGGRIVPVTVLHHNDAHGNLARGSYAGYTQLVTLIKQERAHNPKRTLLLSGGDNVQGDAMMYWFKSAPSGAASDGTPLPAALQTHPMMAAMNAMAYDAMTLGNHEFNFGSAVFKGIMGQAQFPVLGANVADDGRYGLAAVTGGAGVKPYVEKTVGDEGIRVAILGITNHRVPSYELPSNIVGLTFSDPIAAASNQTATLRARNDVVIALSHLGFTTNPRSVEVDANVDTNLAGQVSGIDAIIGSHSHTNPAAPESPYKYLPALIPSPSKIPVLVHHAYRWNNTLGETLLGLRARAGGGYEVVTRAGQYLSVTSAVAEDAALKAIVDPYAAALADYNGRTVGKTTTPIDTLAAFTAETNGANLQAEASRFELHQRGIDVDLHLSGAMTNKLVAATATDASPVSLTIADLFGAMPYENSLVVLRMNGPQLKRVLERGYRNYFYYKYVADHGGYSYYTTCMLDVDGGGRIMYRDAQPSLPDGNNVAALVIGGKAVDFDDASTFYRVSTVNYLAAGSCNFSDDGKTLWPLDQIVADTQHYVRDAVIDYLAAEGTVSPRIEGRILYGDADAPTVAIQTPTDGGRYPHNAALAVSFAAADATSGLRSVQADVDGTAVTAGQELPARGLAAGAHVLTVVATDRYGNATTGTARFEIGNTAPVATPQTATAGAGSPIHLLLAGADADGDPLTFRVTTQPAHGTLSGSGANLVYTPAAGYVGVDAFAFVANDGTTDSAPATVSLTLTQTASGGKSSSGGCASGGLGDLGVVSLLLTRLAFRRRRSRDAGRS